MDDIGVATRLYHEIEHYNPAIGNLIAWVNLTTLLSTQETIFYLYYGNSQCQNQQTTEKVWDDGYCGVWHLNNVQDSTQNENNGVNYGTDSIIGKVGLAKDFNYGNYISFGDMSEPCNNLLSTLTVEFWMNPETLNPCPLVNKVNSQLSTDKKTYGSSLTGTGYPGPVWLSLHYITTADYVVKWWLWYWNFT